jgi:hypothetical protein
MGLRVKRLIKSFSQNTHLSRKILNTRNSSLGFDPNRNYDEDLSRLGKMETSQSELRNTNALRDEMRKMNKEMRQISE